MWGGGSAADGRRHGPVRGGRAGDPSVPWPCEACREMHSALWSGEAGRENAQVPRSGGNPAPESLSPVAGGNQGARIS